VQRQGTKAGVSRPKTAKPSTDPDTDAEAEAGADTASASIPRYLQPPPARESRALRAAREAEEKERLAAEKRRQRRLGPADDDDDSSFEKFLKKIEMEVQRGRRRDEERRKEAEKYAKGYIPPSQASDASSRLLEEIDKWQRDWKAKRERAKAPKGPSFSFTPSVEPYKGRKGGKAAAASLIDRLDAYIQQHNAKDGYLEQLRQQLYNELHYTFAPALPESTNPAVRAFQRDYASSVDVVTRLQLHGEAQAVVAQQQQRDVAAVHARMGRPDVRASQQSLAMARRAHADAEGEMGMLDPTAAATLPASAQLGFLERQEADIRQRETEKRAREETMKGRATTAGLEEEERARVALWEAEARKMRRANIALISREQAK
jgi:hypothetical protein